MYYGDKKATTKSIYENSSATSPAEVGSRRKEKMNIDTLSGMDKAIVLTQIKITDIEKELLKNTNVFKIALNQHAEELKPNIRIVTDYSLGEKCFKFPQKIISIRERFRFITDKVIYPKDIKFKGSTILASLDWLIQQNYRDILIIGDNTVNTKEFQDKVNEEIEKIKHKANIYQFSNGNFNLPVISIKEFLGVNYDNESKR